MRKKKICIYLISIFFAQTLMGLPLMTMGVEFGKEYHYAGSSYFGGRFAYSPLKKIEINLSGNFHEWRIEVNNGNYDYAKVDEFFLIPTFSYILLKESFFSFKIGAGAGINVSSMYFYYGMRDVKTIRLDHSEIFPSLLLLAEISYNIPKTNIHLSLGLRHHDHLGYWKELNHYFSLVYSLSFEIFK